MVSTFIYFIAYFIAGESLFWFFFSSNSYVGFFTTIYLNFFNALNKQFKGLENFYLYFFSISFGLFYIVTAIKSGFVFVSILLTLGLWFSIFLHKDKISFFYIKVSHYLLIILVLTFLMQVSAFSLSNELIFLFGFRILFNSIDKIETKFFYVDARLAVLFYNFFSFFFLLTFLLYIIDIKDHIFHFDISIISVFFYSLFSVGLKITSLFSSTFCFCTPEEVAKEVVSSTAQQPAPTSGSFFNNFFSTVPSIPIPLGEQYNNGTLILEKGAEVVPKLDKLADKADTFIDKADTFIDKSDKSREKALRTAENVGIVIAGTVLLLTKTSASQLPKVFSKSNRVIMAKAVGTTTTLAGLTLGTTGTVDLISTVVISRVEEISFIARDLPDSLSSVSKIDRGPTLKEMLDEIKPPAFESVGPIPEVQGEEILEDTTPPYEFKEKTREK
jgi:hypothetical protein